LRTNVDGVADAMKKIGIDHVHLGVRPGLEAKAEQFLAAVEKQQWTVSATMIDFPQEDYSTLESIKVTGGVGPDEYWEKNQELFLGATDLTVQLGVKYLTMHAGFIDESDAAYAEKFYERIRSLADAAGEKNIMLLLETGQETAEET
jgi:sugar phosphate isomerase/epimerase